jgi:hypothetical protein
MRVEQQPEVKKIEPFVPPQPMGKIAGIIVLATASSVLFWWVWHATLSKGLDFTSFGQAIMSIILPVAFFCLRFCIMSLVMVAVRHFWLALVAGTVVSLPIFVFFRFSIWSLLAYIVAVVSWAFWYRQVVVEVDNQLKFSAGRIIKAGLSSTITLMLLVVSICYFAFTVNQSGGSTAFADRLIDNSAKIMENILHTYYQEKFDPQMTLDTFIYNVGVAPSSEKVKSMIGQEKLNDVIQQGITAAEQVAVEEARDSFLETFRIEASGDETMHVVVQKIVRRNADHYLNKFYKFIPGLVALSVFFLLNIFNIVYRELIAVMSYLLFRVMIAAGFFHIKKIQVDAEKFSL